MIFSIRLEERQRLNEIRELDFFDFNKKIDDFERLFDIYMITTVFDFTNSNFTIILTTMNIFSLSKLKRTTSEQSARFWEILKCLRQNRNKNINIIRVWNNREKYIKTRNLKHSLKLAEINETLNVNKVELEINKAETAKVNKLVNKRFIVIRNLKVKLKEKIKKESSNYQDVDVFSEINYDEKINLFKIHSKSKKLTSKYTDSSIFYEHKNSDVLDYIRYNIWKDKCVNKLKINANWYFTEKQQVIAIIQWLEDKIAKHIHIRRKVQRHYFIDFDQFFKLLDIIYVDANHDRNIRRQYVDFRMKFSNLYNEFYSKFLLLINQLFNKSDENKIHDLKKKLIVKLKLIMNNLNNFILLKAFYRKIQTIDNRHRRIQNDDDKNRTFSNFFKSSNHKQTFRIRRNEKYLTKLIINYINSIEKKIYKVVITRSSVKKECRRCENLIHWWKKCKSNKSLFEWIDDLIKKKILNI